MPVRFGVLAGHEGRSTEPEPDAVGRAEAKRLRRSYLVALTYPLWHLAAPEGARDPWILWWLVAASFAALAALSLVSDRVSQRLRHLFPICSWLVALHLYTLASWNDMSPFYVVGSVMAVITTVVFIRNRPGLLGYMGFLSILTVSLYRMDPSTTKLAYWGGVLSVMPLAYLRLDLQLRREAMARDMATELETRVEERTHEVLDANRRLQEEIAERKRLEGHLRFSHKMEVLGRIAGGLAHDFNNLLTTVNVYAELVIDGLEPHSSVRGDAEQIQKTTRQASSLTQQLLAFSRGNSEQRVIDMNEAVLEASQMLRRILPEKTVFDYRLADRTACVRAGPDQLGRVLMNLILNARDAMPDGGSLHVEVAIRDEDLPEALDAEAGAEYVVLTVTDTGRGMDEETLSRAFDPFFTRRPDGEGTGLGLSIVYGIVEQAGGHVRAESEVGRGTRFEVYWPFEAATVGAPASQRQPLPQNPGAERILLVEDEAALRTVLVRVLRENGYEVVGAVDGEAALAELEDPAVRFDLVLSDLVMPRMNGYELADRLRRWHPETKVLLMSAQSNHASLGGREPPPGVDLLAKPFELRDLALRVRSVLEAPPRA